MARKNPIQRNLKVVQPILNRRNPFTIGDKAASLSKMQKMGFRIPKTYAIGWNAFRRYKAGDEKMLDEVRNDLALMIDPEKKYAVRSSSNLEDSMQFSFAGQFESLLNVQGAESILDAIVQVWRETDSPQLKAYIAKSDLDDNEILMGVIIQEMVEPVLSGVTLTRNPVTFAGEVMIEAVAGYGDELMQKGMNAQRWTIRDGEITSGNSDNGHSALVMTLAQDAEKMKKALKMDLDIEWAYDGSAIYYLQARPISSLTSIKIYSNRISRDMLPGMIKPLVWSVNIPLVNSVWIGILESIVGPLGIAPEDLAHAFFYRTYFNMGIFGEVFKSMGMPPDALESMMGLKKDDEGKSAMRPGKEMARHIPRIVRFGAKHLTIGMQIKRDLAEIEKTLDTLDYRTFPEKDSDYLFEEIEKQKILVKKIVYYNIVAPLLMGFHNRMLKRHLEKVGMDFLNFDLMKDEIENNAYDPNHFLAELNAAYQALPNATQDALITDAESTLETIPEDDPFITAFETFIETFGHFSDSGNDFSYAPWRENMGLMMQMIANYAASKDSAEKTSIEDVKTGPLRKLAFKRAYRQARKFRLLRERVSSSYIYGYGLFRYLFLALGDKLVKRKILDTKEDIFYLEESQIRAIFANTISKEIIQKSVRYHKNKMKEQENITPPEVIYGQNEPVLNIEASSEFQGVPASAGFYSGPACVVRSANEFEKVKEGDVLIIPFSDVGWTPLFPKAGAVVSESGGMLSHCAIVAREYGIPSVVSALGIMGVKDGQVLTVDANAGVVYINEE